MKLEVGKTYKTRGGDKVKVVYVKTHGSAVVVSLDETWSTTYAPSGRVHDDGKPHELDLVAEDIPTRTYYRAAVYKADWQGGRYESGLVWFASEEKLRSNYGGNIIEIETRELPDLGE